MDEHDTDEYEIPDDDTCADCGCTWPEHQGGDNGVTCTTHGHQTYNHVPAGWR